MEFAGISGLNCNIEKTCIMFIGPRDPVEEAGILEQGFSVVESIKILGFQVDNSAEQLGLNFSSAEVKIKKLIATWLPFKLSMIGRINISKTFLISQVLYIGAVLTPDPDIIIRLQSTIDNYVLNKMPFAADRLYRRTEDGGLGLLNIKTMLESLQCSWFKRILTDGINDNWHFNQMNECFFNVNCFRLYQLDALNRPLEYNIGSSFWNFLVCYWSTDHNFLSAPLLLNPCFNQGIGDNGKVDTRLMDCYVVGTESFRQNTEFWLNFKISDMLRAGQLKSFHDLRNSVTVEITFNVYLSLRRSVCQALVKFNNRPSSSGKNLPVEEFLNRRSKGAKIFRKYLDNRNRYKTTASTYLGRYAAICGTTVPDTDTVTNSSLVGLWAKSFLPVTVRIFAFQLVNNSLAVGARLGNRYGRDPD